MPFVGSAFGNFGGPAVDECWPEVVLLLHFDGSNGSTTFTDSSSYARTTTSVAATVVNDTGTSKFGTASGNFTNGYFRYADAAEFDVGSANFCVEAWVMFNTDAFSSDRVCVIGGQHDNAGGNYPWAITKSTSNTVGFSGYISGGGSYSAGSTNTVAASTWYHMALVRNGTSMTLYVDGVAWASTTVSGALINPTTAFGIGVYGEYDGAYGGSFGTRMMGWLDEIRYTVGCARYTADFTPPTAAFPNS